MQQQVSTIYFKNVTSLIGDFLLELMTQGGILLEKVAVVSALCICDFADRKTNQDMSVSYRLKIRIRFNIEVCECSCKKEDLWHLYIGIMETFDVEIYLCCLNYWTVAITFSVPVKRSLK